MSVNKQLSEVFDQIADLMEIRGDDSFRINTYRRAARTFKDLTDDIAELAAEKRLTDISGVGKGTADRIQQYLDTGKIDVHEELLAAVPAGLPPLLDIPSLGPKKLAAAWKELGVENLDDLKNAIESGELAKLPKMGATSVQKIADGIAFLEKSSGRTPLGVATAIAERMIAAIEEYDDVDYVRVAGSLRRGCETIGDIDILCQSDDGEAVVKFFTELDMVSSVLAAGKTKGSVLVDAGGGREIQVDLRVVPTLSYGAALQYFTGSKEHNVRVREIAAKRKWKLNEYGLYNADGDQIGGANEHGLYDTLDLPFVPPEMREDRGELEADPKIIDNLVELKHIRGDLHMHTTASDGKCTIEAMARAAADLGYKYIAICDHSKSSAIANGLSIERMEKHIEAIRAANRKIKAIEILVGTECDILGDGSMDYPDELLAECDIVVASVHAGMGQDRDKVTRRTIAAIENPYVTIIGHPTGRLINRREPMDLDMAKVIDAAKATGTVLEINASWQRLDLKDVHAKQALDAGVMLSIDTDSHHTDQLYQMRFGVQVARRAWAQKGDILNTHTLAQLQKIVAKKRGKK